MLTTDCIRLDNNIIIIIIIYSGRPIDGDSFSDVEFSLCLFKSSQWIIYRYYVFFFCIPIIRQYTCRVTYCLRIILLPVGLNMLHRITGHRDTRAFSRKPSELSSHKNANNVKHVRLASVFNSLKSFDISIRLLASILHSNSDRTFKIYHFIYFGTTYSLCIIIVLFLFSLFVVYIYKCIIIVPS